MLYGKLELDGTVKTCISEDNLRKLFPDTLLPKVLTDNNLSDFGYVCVETTPPEDGMVMDSTTRFKFTVENIDGVWKRIWFLSKVPVEEIPSRIENKFSEIRKKRDTLLAKTDYTQTSDYALLRDEYRIYRQQLRNITEGVSDPFLITFPKEPSIIKNSTNIDERKLYLISKVRAKFLVESRRPKVLTSLGFSMDGGSEDYLNLSIGSSLGITSVRDTDNIIHTVTSEELTTIIDEIKTNSMTLTQNKWIKEQEINACTTLTQLSKVII